METKKPLDKRLVAVIIALVLIIAALCFFLFFRLNPASEDDGPRIGYATEASVMLDQDSLQAAMDAAMQNAKDGNIALLYKNNAFSKNGTDFDCYIVNSAANMYDMFLTIFSDPELTDQIFLSGLVPPGSGFEHITLDRALEPGDHTVCVAVTQVTEDKETGEQVIKHQVVHTMEFHVEA